MSKYLLTVVLGLCALISYAQSSSTVSLRGIIADEQHRPLEKATILLSDLQLQTVSAADGSFIIKNLKRRGSVKISITALGFQSYQARIDLAKDSILHIHLKEAVQQLEGIAVQGRQQEQLTAVQHRLKAELVEESKGKLLADVFAKLAGVSVLNTGQTIAKPVINGLHSNRILLLNQGVKLESQQWGAEHAPEMDAFAAEQFEVIKGAQAVRYGADALGGVLIANSSKIDPQQVSGRVDLIGQSNGRGGSANLQLEGGTSLLPSLAWRFQASGKKLGNSKTADYYLGNTGVEELNFSGTLHYGTERSAWDVYYSRYATEIGIFYGAHVGTVEDILARIEHGKPLEEYDFSYNIAAPRQLVNHQLAKLNYQYQLADAWKLEAQYSWQQNHRREFDMRRAVADDVPMSNMKLHSQQLDVLLKNKFHTFGLSSHVQVNNNINGTGTTPIIPNYDSYGFGLFGIHEYHWEKIGLEAGWRYDFKHFDAAGYRYQYASENDELPQQYLMEDQRNFHNISGSLGMRYSIDPQWTFKSNAGLAWRAPTANELYSDGVHHGAGIYEIGNLDLNAERGIKWVNSIAHVQEKLNFTLDIFGQYIYDYIYANPNPDSVRQTIRGTFPVFSYRQDNALFYGADLNVAWNVWQELNYHLAASIVRAKNQSLDSYLPYIPADRFAHSLQWSFDKHDRTYVKLTHEFVARQKRYQQGSDYTAPPAAYQLLHAHARKAIDLQKKQLSFSLAVENILNTSYKDYMDRFRYYAHRPGRNISLSISLLF